MPDFTPRLNNLSDSQRQRLADRLNALPRKNSYRQLVAFVQVCNTFNEDNLREHLAENLPDYMLPGHYVELDVLPQTANGKIDRSSLVIPSAKKDQAIKLNNVEKTLSSIWCEVLDMDIIHADDNYFELGGDSISSIQMISRASKSGLSFTPADLMEHPSIRGLAHKIALKQSSTKTQSTDTLSNTIHDKHDIQDEDEILRVLDLD